LQDKLPTDYHSHSYSSAKNFRHSTNICLYKEHLYKGEYHAHHYYNYTVSKTLQTFFPKNPAYRVIQKNQNGVLMSSTFFIFCDFFLLLWTPDNEKYMMCKIVRKSKIFLGKRELVECYA
jgi:hypothetical protein